MLAGSIKFFVADKGYGFILPDDGTGDVFFHHRAVDDTGLACHKPFVSLVLLLSHGESKIHDLSSNINSFRRGYCSPRRW